MSLGSGSQPITTKSTTVDVSNRLYVATCRMQGWRETMEDYQTVLLSPEEDPSTSFFGVFDGHGGYTVAEHASRRLHTSIMTNDMYRAGDVIQGIEQGFLSLDDELRAQAHLHIDTGSTAVVVLIKGHKYFCGNAGDSGAFANAHDYHIIALSEDHKATTPSEKTRIRRAGYNIIENRLNGDLAVTRGLADFRYKMNENLPPDQQAVTCFPEVRSGYIRPSWQYIFIASDGIWEAKSREETAAFIKIRLDRMMRPEHILRELFDACLAPRGRRGGSYDNMDAIIIVFMSHMTKEYRKILQHIPGNKQIKSAPRKKRPEGRSSKRRDETNIPF